MQKPANRRRSAPFRPSRRRPFRPLAGSIAALLLGVALALPGAAPAATITWTAATNISGDTDVDTQGTLVGAFSLNDGGATGATVNGVDFVGTNVGSGTSVTFGNFSLSVAGPDTLVGSSEAGGTVPPFTNLSTAYQALLSADGTDTNYTPLTLTMSGLTIGMTYQFEWWSSASDATDAGATFPTTATAGNAVTLSANTAGAVGGIGQFSIGTFVATGASQQIVFSGPDEPGLNAFELRSTGVAALPATYWLGGTDGTWIGNNWASDATGTSTSATPTSTDDVTFSASGATHQSTTLGANFTIHSLTINDSTAVTINSGTGGPFTLTLSGNAGTGITVNSGAGLLTIGANVTLAGSSDTITVSNAAGAVITGVVGGDNGLTKLGPGTLTLTGANNYSGTTTVTAGTLQIGDGVTAGTTIATSGQVQIGAGGTLAINLSSGSTFANAVNNGGALNAIASGTNTLSGIISGSGAFRQNGSGTTILTAADSYSGATTVTVGTLQIGNGTSGNLTGTSGVTVTNSGTLALNLGNNGVFTPGVVANGAGTTVNAIASGTNTLSGIISGSGAFSQTGSGTTVLTTTDSYSGATAVTAGTLQIGNGTSGNLTGTSGVTVTNSGTLALNLGNNGVFTPGVVANGAGTTVNAIASGTNTLSGIVSGSGAFSQTGSGTTILTATDSYSGATTVTAGTLQIGNGTSGNLTGTSGVTVRNSGTLALDLGNNGVFTPGVVANGVSTTVNAVATGTNTLSGIISGTGAFSQTGSGTTILTGVNSYSGATTVTVGKLQIGNGTSGNLTGTSGVTVTNSGTLALDLGNNGVFTPGVVANGVSTTVNAIATGTNTLSGMISGTGAFNQTGSGTTILTGASNYSGATTVIAGTLQIGDGTTTGTSISNSGQVQVGASGTLAIDLSDGSTFFNAVNDGGAVNEIASPGINQLFGVISGGGKFNQTGTGTTILTGANTYSGGTTISAGTLQIGGGAMAGSITGNVTDNAALVFYRSDSVTFSGNITGSGSVIKQGAETLALTGTGSNYAGGTAIIGGEVSINNANAVGSGDINLSVGTEFNSTANVILGNNVIFASNGRSTVSAAAGATLTLGGMDAGSGGAQMIFGSVGNTGVVQVGPKANTFGVSPTSTIEVAFGTLRNGGGVVGGLSFFTSQNISTTVDSGATLDVNDGNMTVTQLLGSGSVILGSSTATVLTVNSGTFGGIISGAGQLDTETAGTLVLTGANTYTGGTTIGFGTLEIGNGGATGSIAGDVTDNAALVFDRNATFTYGGAITGSGSVHLEAGDLTLTGANNFSGGTTIDGATTLEIGSGGTIGSITGNVTDNGTLVFNRSDNFSLAGNITGNGSVTKEGSGTLILTGAGSNYSGGTAIIGGEVSINNANAVGSGDINLSVGTEFNSTANVILGNNVIFASNGRSTVSAAAGATLTLGGMDAGSGGAQMIFGSVGNTGVVQVGPLTNTFAQSPTATIEVAFGTLRNGGGVVGDLSFFTSHNTSTTVDSGATLDVNDNSMTVNQLLGTGSVTLGSSTATVLTVNSGTFGGIISGAGQLDKETAGTLVLTGANSYTGGTTIGGGTLQIGNGGATGSITGDVTNNGVLAFDRIGNVTFDGLISGSGTLMQSGTGTLTLTNANTYQGATSVNAGALYVNGSLAVQSTVTVQSAATLGGTGTIAGTVNLLSGGNLNPGTAAAPGTLTIGTLVLNAGANSNFRLAQSGVAGGGVNDLVAVTGNLTLEGILNVTPLAGFGLGSYPLFTYTGALTNDGFSAINGLTGFTGTLVTTTPHEVDLLITLGLAQYWDGAKTTGTGLVAGGSGSWNTTTTNWTNATGTTNAKWQGGTAIFAAPGGTVTLTSAIGAEALLFNSTGYTIAGSSVLTLTGTTPTIGVAGAGSSATITAKIAGTGGITASGAGTLILANAAEGYTGGTAIGGGTVQVGTATVAGSLGAGAVAVSNGATLSLVNVTGAKLTDNITNGVGGVGTVNLEATATTTLAGTLTDGATGQLALTQSSTKTTILANAANTYSGATTVSAGILQIGTATVPGSIGANSAINVGTGGTLALFDVSGNSFTNNIANGLGGTGLVSINSTTSLTFSGTLDDGSGPLALTKSGTGTATLTGADTYTGATSVTAGTLQVGNGTAGNLTGPSAVTVSASGTLATDLAASSTLSSNIALSTTTASLKAIQAGVNTLSGVISGTGTFNQNGTGRTILTNTETYTGATNVNAGILQIDGSLTKGTGSGEPPLPLPGGSPATASLVTVNQGGTLGGSGTVGGAITLKLGCTVEPGIGSLGTAGTTLSAGSMLWNTGATLTLQLGATTEDELALTGALTKGTAGTFTLDLLNAGIASQTTYLLATFGSTTFKATDFHLELPAGYTGMLVETSTSLELENLAAVHIESPRVSAPSLTTDPVGSVMSDSAALTVVPTPEPGSATLLALGGAALLGWRRRRKV